MGNALNNQILATGTNWLWGLGILVGAVLIGLLVSALFNRVANRVLRRRSEHLPLGGELLRRLPAPFRLFVPLVFVYATLPLVRPRLGADAGAILDGALHVMIVVSLAWLVIAVLFAGEEAVVTHYTIDTPNNLKARRIVTQVRILRRIATTVVVVVAVGLAFLQYETFRELGTGILASAGIIGIVVGIAAQRTLADLIAGIQIALTQPIRVDDIVIVEGEFGWVEEITLTYVVVRVWDRRRVVMPITHFIEKPFQNWTRTSTDLIGSVFLHVDYRAPVEDVRIELQRVVEASDYWDGDVCALQVTDTSERSIELRAIASAENAPQLWELRCEIRESLISYLRDHHPDALPVVRARVEAEESSTESQRPN